MCHGSKGLEGCILIRRRDLCWEKLRGRWCKCLSHLMAESTNSFVVHLLELLNFLPVGRSRLLQEASNVLLEQSRLCLNFQRGKGWIVGIMVVDVVGRMTGRMKTREEM